MAKTKMRKKIIRVLLFIIIVIALVLTGCYLISNKDRILKGKNASQASSEVEKLKAKDLELKYPSTPTEVVKLYWRLNKCMYNNSMKDEDFEALLKQLRMLYDEELLGEEENSWDNMLQNFETDKKAFSKAKRVISVYTVDSDSAVEYAELEGKECATLTSSTLETVKSKNTKTYAKFMCRKDSDGKWKILGWEQIDASEASVEDE